MATPHARHIASHLIHEHFGELVKKVWNCLADRGHLYLGEIGRSTQLAPAVIRNCLLVLIQHNCVQAFRLRQEGAFGADPTLSTYYIAFVDNVLHRLRFPKFLLIVQQQLGEVAESIVTGLLQHGRLMLHQIVKRAEECSSDTDVAAVKESLAVLVRSHFVERCPLAEPELKKAEPPPKKKPRMARQRTTVIAEPMQQRVTTSATLSDSDRFQIPWSFDDFDLQQSSGPSVGQKRRKRPEVCEDEEILWRVNYEEFLRCLRHKACVKYVTSRLGNAAGTVLSCMLEATRESETKLKELCSDALSLDTVSQAVMATPSGRTMTLEHIRPALISMVDIGVVERVGETASQYSINMQKIIQLARQSDVEGVVLKRLGRKGYRIFRHLCTKGFVDQKQLLDLGPPQETWSTLYALLRENFVEYQEVFPSATDRTPAKAIYLWNVNHANVARNLLNNMCHALWNLMQRLAHELEQEQELFSLLKSGVKLTSTQQQQANRLSNIAKVLEVSLLKLDDEIMLFHDF